MYLKSVFVRRFLCFDSWNWKNR